MDTDNFNGIAEQLLEVIEDSGRAGFMKAIVGFFTRKASTSKVAARIRKKFNLNTKDPQFKEIINRAVSDAAIRVNIKSDLLKAFLNQGDNCKELFELILSPNIPTDFNKKMTMGIIEKDRLERFLNILPEAIREAKQSIYSPSDQEILARHDHPFSFKTWEEWSSNVFHQIKVAETENFLQQINSIKEIISKEKAVLRIVGLSGLGKSRLAIEALKPSENDSLSSFVRYTEDGNFPNRSLLKSIEYLVSKQIKAIIVVDDCEIDLHDKLAEIVNKPSSKLSLLTLDFEGIQGKQGITNIVELSPETQKSVVSEMIQQSPHAEAFDDSDLRRAEKFAQGYPEIARLILEAWSAGKGIGESLTDDRLIDRLLFGRNEPDRDARKILRGLSIFSHFGFKLDPKRPKKYKEDPKEQFKFIAENVCKSTEENVFEISSDFRRRGILEERGQYMRVRPRPLAIRLAAEWWEKTHPDIIKDVIDKVDSVNLTEALCRQMEFLSDVSSAKEIVESLCAEDAPFGKAEILGSNTGSRIIRSFAVINSSAVMKALDHAFGSKSTDQLKVIKDGRRNLVYTLQELAWENETFEKATWLLLCFSAAENESWANNATGQFLQLFHVYLSGTKVPAFKRISILEKGLNSNDPARRKVAIRGLGSALTSDHFSRSGGIEYRGGNIARKDWQPETYKEKSDYYKTCLEILTRIALEKSSNSVFAREEFENKITSLIVHGQILDNVISSIHKIAPTIDGTWDKAIREVNQVIIWHKEKMPDSVSKKLHDLLKYLEPKNINDRVKHIIRAAPNYSSHKRDKKGNIIDEGVIKAQKLAIELCTKDVDWDDILKIVNQGQQAYTVPFGKAISENLSNSDTLIEKSIQVLQETSKEDTNWGFLAGLLSTKTESEQDEVLQRILTNKQLKYGYIILLKIIGVTEKRLGEISELLVVGEYDKADIEQLRYSLNTLPINELEKFGKNVFEQRKELSSTLLEVLEFSTDNEKNEPKSIDSLFRKIIVSGYSLFTQKETSNWSYAWRNVFVRLLSNNDSEFAIRITEQLIDSVISSERYRSINYEMTEVLRHLLRNYYEEVWPIFSKHILINDINSFKLLELVARSPIVNFEAGGSGGILFEEVTNDEIIKWAKENSPKAPKILGQITPIFEASSTQGKEPDVDKAKWNSVALLLIDTFGDSEGFLNQLGQNLFSFGSIGSRVPYYERRITLLKQLLDHESSSVREFSEKSIRQFQRHIYDELEEEKEEQLRYGE